MSFIYIRKFKPNLELPFKVKENKLYKGEHVVDNTHMVYVDDIATISVTLPTTDEEGYYIEAEELTDDNKGTFKLSKQDMILLTTELEMERLDEQDEKEINELYENLGELEAVDPMMLKAIGKVIAHITSTYSDKYEASALPDVDLTGLMRNAESVHATGFNIGNSLKYLKRYLTKGFSKSGDVNDLLKSVHYQCMEIDRKTNEE